MISRIDINGLLHSNELKALWQTIKQELPELHFYEEDKSMNEARIDSLEDSISECNRLLCEHDFQELSIRDLYACLSSDCFRIFCEESLLELEKAEIIIDGIEQDFILNELGISEDEYKKRCKTYDILNIISWSIEYYLLNKHPKILLDYYKMEGYDESEQMAESQLNIYSRCEKLATNKPTE